MSPDPDEINEPQDRLGAARYRIETREDVRKFYKEVGINVPGSETEPTPKDKYGAAILDFELTEEQKRSHYSPVLGVPRGTPVDEIKRRSNDPTEALNNDYKKFLYALNNQDEDIVAQNKVIKIIYGPGPGFYKG